MLFSLRPIISASALSSSRLFSSAAAAPPSCAWSPNASGVGWKQLLSPTSILRVYPALYDNYYYLIKNMDASPSNCEPKADYLLSDCPEGCLEGVKDAITPSNSPTTLNIFLTHHHADHTAGLDEVLEWAASRETLDVKVNNLNPNNLEQATSV